MLTTNSPLVIDQKKLSRDFIWNLGSLVVVGVCGIALNALIARYLGTAILGVFNQVFACYILLSQLAVYGFHFSVLRDVSYDPKDAKIITESLSSALLLGLIFSTMIAVMTYGLRFVGGALLNSSAVSLGLALVAPGLVFFSLNKILLNVLNGLNALRAYSVFQTLRFLLLMLGILIVITYGWDGTYVCGALTCAEIVLFLLLIIFTHFRVASIKFSAITQKSLKQHFSFGSRGFFSGAMSEINTRVDVLALGFFLSDALVGVYSFAAIIAEGFGQISMVGRRLMDPILGEAFAKNDFSKVKEMAHKIKKYFFPAMLITGVIALLLYPLIVTWLTDSLELQQGQWVFGVLISGLIINALYRPFLGILLQGGKPGTHSLMATMLVLLNLLGNLLLIPICGLLGAAVATAVVFVIEAVLIRYYARVCFRLNL